MSIIDYIMKEHSKIEFTRRMTVKREQFIDTITFKPNSKIMFKEIFGPLSGLKDEWKLQGATEEEQNFTAFKYREALYYHIPVITGYFGPDQSKILEETDEYIIFNDVNGIKNKLIKKVSTLALPLEHPVKNMDDWRKIKQYYLFYEERIPKNVVELINAKRDEGYVITARITGGFYTIRELLGTEEMSLSVYTQPELLKDIFQTFSDTNYKIWDIISRQTQIDMLFVGEDMAGKTGPLWGPKQVDEFIKPYYRRIWELLNSRGTKVFLLDSDGDLRPIIPNLIDSGINFIHPCEVMANMDIVKLREKYGNRLAFEGGIDKYVLLKTKPEIEEELEYKLPPMIKTGGYVTGLDHRIVNGITIENYRFYINKVWEIISREEK